MEFEIKRITNGPKHHLFGFHDLVQTNAKGDLALCLEVDDISHPPLPGDTCLSGIVPADGGEFAPIHETHTWNYPQGARQQWIGDGDLFTCNDRDDNGKVFAWVADARARKTIEKLPFPVHCLNASTRMAFWMDYDRTYACGGYGYSGSSHRGKWVDIPEDNGIYAGNLDNGKSGVLVTMTEVAKCGEPRPVRTGYPHIVTHFLLNPTGDRIAFLHRYLVPDGGGITRLMTVGTDGCGLRCLAKGFLSHFTWISSDQLMIWGDDQRSLCAFRESPYLRIPGVLQLAQLAKAGMRSVRNVLRRKNGGDFGGNVQSKAFLVIDDRDNGEIRRTAVGVLTEDGHPMARPGNLKMLINDTYPDASGDRTLMLYDVDGQKRQDIGTFRRLFAEPDMAAFDWKAALLGRDPRVNRKADIKAIMFYASGLHCDLHPRWSFDGKMAYFDSIHEGTRQVYSVEGV